MANPFTGAGKVQYIPDKVKSPVGDIEIPEDYLARSLALEFDNGLADILELGEALDTLEEAANQQLADMDIPATPGTEDQIRRICDGDTITLECYEKALGILKALPQVVFGYDPVQAIHGTTIADVVGPKLTSCKDFDPNLFFGNNTETAEDTANDQKTDQTKKVNLNELMERARKNQEKWAKWILFWDVIWGKASMKEPFKSQSEENDSMKMMKTPGGTTNLLPTQGRPQSLEQLMWEAFPPSAGPLDTVLRGGPYPISEYKTYDQKVSSSAVIWKEPWSMIGKGEIRVRDKGIPSIEVGFLLPLIIGLISLPAKVLELIFSIYAIIRKKMSIFKKIPIVGGAVFKVMTMQPDLIFGIVAVIQGIFIEISIWLAIKPFGYNPDFGSPDDAVPTINPQGAIDEKATTEIEIEDTPGGWMPLDCFKAAQTVVNTVNNDAVS